MNERFKFLVWLYKSCKQTCVDVLENKDCAELFHLSKYTRPVAQVNPSFGGSIWWDLIPFLSEIGMSSPGRAADKRVWASGQCDIGTIICTEASEISKRIEWRKKKKMVIIPENDLDWFSQTSSVKRLPRQQTHPHYPNSWPSITTWHHYNTLSLTPPRQNSHYIHLLWALHSTDTHPSRGKGLRVGKFTHSESTTHTHSHRSTPATYLYYITHATAYPSTTRSALHSATDGDASPELLHAAEV